jgi:hypothetical protein
VKIYGHTVVRVRLTNVGVGILNRRDQRLVDTLPVRSATRDYAIDAISHRRAGDVYECEIWDLMATFGEYVTPGCMVPFVGSEIEIVDRKADHLRNLKRRMYRVR